MDFKFKFDPVNRILLAQIEGQLTAESLAEFYKAARECSTATGAAIGIVDVSLVTDFFVPTEFLRQLAKREPAMAPTLPRIIVAPQTLAFGLARMFQIFAEPKRPRFAVVRTLEEALVKLKVQSPQFEPFEPPSRPA